MCLRTAAVWYLPLAKQGLKTSFACFVSYSRRCLFCSIYGQSILYSFLQRRLDSVGAKYPWWYRVDTGAMIGGAGMIDRGSAVRPALEEAVLTFASPSHWLIRALTLACSKQDNGGDSHFSPGKGS